MGIRFLLLNQLTSLREAGYEVMAVCSPGSYVPEIEGAGVRVIPVPMARSAAPWADLKALVTLYRILRWECPTIVHTHTPKAALLGQYAALFARVPIKVHTIHGLYFPGQMSPRTRPLYVWLERITMRFADLALSQNPEDIPVAIEESICRPDQITYLGNGIDLAHFDPSGVDPPALANLRCELGLNEQDKVVGIVGRVNREKGYIEFFEAAASTSEQESRAKFLVIGPVESEKANALDPMMLARKFGLESQVLCLGFRRDMPELYSLMDVLVLPSHREGVPRAPMEAAAMGRPTVATNIRGCRQVVVDEETGYLVPVRDPEALARAVIRILRDGVLAQRMGEAARRYALQHFDERQVIARMLEAYDSLLTKRVPGC